MGFTRPHAELGDGLAQTVIINTLIQKWRPTLQRYSYSDMFFNEYTAVMTFGIYVFRILHSSDKKKAWYRYAGL